MARVCELTGKRVMTGNNVSHAHNKTRRRFLPNLTKATLMSDSLGRSFTFKISTHALRSVDHNNGLDNYLVKQRDENLSPAALKVKRDIKKALAAKEA